MGGIVFVRAALPFAACNQLAAHDAVGRASNQPPEKRDGN